MKRSKIFLGITASLLGIVGFAAAKKHFNSTVPFYHTNLGTNPSDCKQLGFSTLYNSEGSGVKEVTPWINQVPSDPTQRIAYQTSQCIVTLYTGSN